MLLECALQQYASSESQSLPWILAIASSLLSFFTFSHSHHFLCFYQRDFSKNKFNLPKKSSVFCQQTLQHITHDPSQPNSAQHFWLRVISLISIYIFQVHHDLTFIYDLHILFPFSEMHLHPSPLEKNSSNVTCSMKPSPPPPGRFKQMDHALVIFVFLEVIAVCSTVLASIRN